MSTTNVVNKTYGDAEWDAQKATIQKIYISDDGSLQALIDIMATSHNFRASKSQYERHFKRWHMRKNLKSHEWKAVRHHSAKRKLNGKESDVYVDGILISHKKVRKETMRNSFASIFDRIAQAPSPRIPEDLIICTPPALQMDILQTQSLPWFRFAASLNAPDQFEHAGSPTLYNSQEKKIQSWQPVCWKKLTAGSPEGGLSRNGSQEPVIDSTLRSNPNGPQDRRLDMINLIPDAHGGIITAPKLLEILCLLPETTHPILGTRIQSSAIQLFRLLLYLLSNNHVHESVTRYVTDAIDVDKTILRIMKARNGLQYKHLFSHSGPTSEALSENIFQSVLKAQDAEVIQTMLNFGIDPNQQRNSHGETPLQYISLQGNVEIASMLIKAGADVNATGSSKFACLWRAATSRNPEMVSLLLAEGAYASTRDGANALLDAVETGDILSVQNLISAGASVTTKYKDGYTVLHFAYRNSEMIRCLIQAGADINAVTDRNRTVIELVVQLGSVDIVRFLLESGLQVFGSAVYFAVNRANIELIRILLNAGAHVDGCFNRSRRTALTRAVEINNASMVKFLLDSGADINGCTLDHTSIFDNPSFQICPDFEIFEGLDDHYSRASYTPLQAASFHKDSWFATTLLKAGADVNTDFTSSDWSVYFGWQKKDPPFLGTAIQIAAHQGNMDLVRLFWNAGANLNAPAFRKGGRTALQAAIENGHHQVVHFLLSVSVDINAIAAEENGRSALTAAVIRQDAGLIDFLLTAGAEINDPYARHSGVTALAAAAANRDIELVRHMLFVGANPIDSAALLGAVQNDDIELVRVLLAARADYNDYEDNLYGYKALCKAIIKNHHELVELLLASKISPNMSTSDGLMEFESASCDWYYAPNGYNEIPPWLFAVQHGDIQTNRLFLEAGSDPNFISGKVFETSYDFDLKQRATYLLAAICYKDLPFMHMLVEAGADVNLRPCSDQRAPLDEAAFLGSTDKVHLLLKAGANVDAPTGGEFGRNALQIATEHGKEDVVDILIEAGADVNALPATYGGVTALQAAAIGGFLRIARVLLEAGADVNAAPAKEEGRTALAGAAEHGRIDMLQFLLNNGANIHGPGQAQYESAVRLAAANGHQAACNLLKSHRRLLYETS